MTVVNSNSKFPGHSSLIWLHQLLCTGNHKIFAAYQPYIYSLTI